MDTHRDTNDSGRTDRSSIPNAFSTKWFEAQINVWARQIDLSLRRIFELGSHRAPAPVAVAAASLLEERGGPVRGCDACPVTSSRMDTERRHTRLNGPGLTGRPQPVRHEPLMTCYLSNRTKSAKADTTMTDTGNPDSRHCPVAQACQASYQDIQLRVDPFE
jgi:hypothetical protein